MYLCIISLKEKWWFLQLIFSLTHSGEHVRAYENKALETEV